MQIFAVTFAVPCQATSWQHISCEGTTETEPTGFKFIAIDPGSSGCFCHCSLLLWIYSHVCFQVQVPPIHGETTTYCDIEEICSIKSSSIQKSASNRIVNPRIKCCHSSRHYISEDVNLGCEGQGHLSWSLIYTELLLHLWPIFLFFIPPRMRSNWTYFLSMLIRKNDVKISHFLILEMEFFLVLLCIPI